MNVAFIGCGKLGMPCAETIAQAGHTVTGYDVDPLARSSSVTMHNSIEEAVKYAKIVLFVGGLNLLLLVVLGYFFQLVGFACAIAISMIIMNIFSLRVLRSSYNINTGII